MAGSKTFGHEAFNFNDSDIAMLDRDLAAFTSQPANARYHVAPNPRHGSYLVSIARDDLKSGPLRESLTGKGVDQLVVGVEYRQDFLILPKPDGTLEHDKDEKSQVMIWIHSPQLEIPNETPLTRPLGNIGLLAGVALHLKRSGDFYVTSPDGLGYAHKYPMSKMDFFVRKLEEVAVVDRDGVGPLDRELALFYQSQAGIEFANSGNLAAIRPLYHTIATPSAEIGHQAVRQLEATAQIAIGLMQGWSTSNEIDAKLDGLYPGALRPPQPSAPNQPIPIYDFLGLMTQLAYYLAEFRANIAGMQKARQSFDDRFTCALHANIKGLAIAATLPDEIPATELPLGRSLYFSDLTMLFYELTERVTGELQEYPLVSMPDSSPQQRAEGLKQALKPRQTVPVHTEPVFSSEDIKRTVLNIYKSPSGRIDERHSDLLAFIGFSPVQIDRFITSDKGKAELEAIIGRSKNPGRPVLICPRGSNQFPAKGRERCCANSEDLSAEHLYDLPASEVVPVYTDQSKRRTYCFYRPSLHHTLKARRKSPYAGPSDELDELAGITGLIFDDMREGLLSPEEIALYREFLEGAVL